MPSLWDYIHINRTDDDQPHRNLQEGLFQIATQTCSILVQVNNTNNISYGNNATNIQYNNYNLPGTSTVHTESEQRVVLLPSDGAVVSSTKNSFRRVSRSGSARRIFSNYKHRLSTVLEGNNQAGDDDFELWDQSQMLRTDTNGGYKWTHSAWCKPSCIPITVILTLIVLVVLLPLLEHANEKSTHAKSNGSNHLCTDLCRHRCFENDTFPGLTKLAMPLMKGKRYSRNIDVCVNGMNIELVESIPEGLVYPDGSPKFMSTFDAWTTLINLANKSIDIGSFYWTLRGTDVYNHTSAWQGEKIFQNLLTSGTQRKIKIRIAQNAPTQSQPNLDTEFLIKRNAAEVRSVNFPRLLGGGVLHTKVWIIDDQHLYLGSANMDWRALTQVKELGVLVRNCTCLAKDVSKIFNAYWFLGRNNSHIPTTWPEEYITKFNENTPLRVNFSEDYSFFTYFSSSPPPMTPRGRTQDLDAIVHTILHAEKFVHISVMDYFPLMIYTHKIKYWPYIDDALRKAAVENRVSVKLLISWWNHSRPSEDYFLKSLETLKNSYKGVDIQVKRFIVPANEDQSKIPFGRVNHNKYMVTDNIAYIGTSNWSGDYFTDTAGIGLVLHDTEYDRNETAVTIRTQLASIFERDWNSVYAIDLKTDFK